VTEQPPQPLAGTRTDIDTASVGLVTIDTGSQAISSCNDAFAELVGRAAHDVLGCLITDFVDDEVQPVATAVIEGIGAGFISSVDGNVDLLGQAGTVRVDCWILALGTDRPHRLAIAGVLPAASTAPSRAEPSEPGFWPARIDPDRIVLATLDNDWRITKVAPGSADRLGWPSPRSAKVMPQLHDLAHPADASTLDESFRRRSSQAPGTFTLRLRGPDEQWMAARVTVSSLRGQAPPQFGLVVSRLHAEAPDVSVSERVSRLEDQLARIRQVVQATDGDGQDRSVDLSDLTMRQGEIVERLLQGHRVDAIARDLYVSPSTVRNHLSAIFEKFGVASQSELIELLRDRPPSDANEARR
jgi:DNA-binding CsgD family transcriptional regulator